MISLSDRAVRTAADNVGKQVENDRPLRKSHPKSGSTACTATFAALAALADSVRVLQPRGQPEGVATFLVT